MPTDIVIPDWLIDRAPADPPDPEQAEREAARRYGRILSASTAASRALGALDQRFAADDDFATAPERYRDALDAIGRDQDEMFGDDRVGREIFRRDFGRLAGPAAERFRRVSAERESAHLARTLEERWASLADLARGADEAGRSELLRQAALEAHRARGFGLVPDAGAAFRAFLDRLAPDAGAMTDQTGFGGGPWGSRTAEYRRDRDGEPAIRTAEYRAPDDPREEMRLLYADENGGGGASDDLGGGAGVSVDATPAAKDEMQAAERMPQKAVTRQKPAPSRAESPLSDAERGRMIDALDEPEGAVSNDPVDPGGLTHYGVTAQGLADYKQRAAPDDPIARKGVSELTKADTRIIFDERIRQYRVDRIEDPHLRQHIFDMVANHPPGIAVRMWQKALNESGMLPNGRKIEEDGVLGPETRQALNGLDPSQGRALNNAMVENRLRFYEAIIKNDPTQERFRPGWWRRENRFRLP